MSPGTPGKSGIRVRTFIVASVWSNAWSFLYPTGMIASEETGRYTPGRIKEGTDMASESGGAELTDWYLARLRANARQETARRLTPLTLVESDKSRIQEIVMQTHRTQEQRSGDLLEKIRKANAGIRTSQTFLELTAIIGTLSFAVTALLLRSSQ